MNRFLVLVSLLLSLFCTGCPDYVKQAQIQAANTVADTSNAVLPMLVTLYREIGFRAIDVAKSEQEALAGIAGIEKKWQPVWKAWETLRVAQDAWANALEHGGTTMAAFDALKNAYCALMKVWPDDVPATPIGVIACGEAITK